jgi:hypothetical protein
MEVLEKKGWKKYFLAAGPPGSVFTETVRNFLALR